MAAVDCDYIEYAKLKDSTRTELNDTYCLEVMSEKVAKLSYDHSVKRLDLEISYGSNTTKEVREMKENSDAWVRCTKSVASIIGMLAKKYKAKPPSCE